MADHVSEQTFGWPSWRYGPSDQAAIFDNEEAVPPGWVDHPAKLAADPLDHDGDGRKGGSRPRAKSAQ